MKTKLLFSLALCGAVLPLSTIGCGGGNGGLLGPNPTATPTVNQPVALSPTTFTLQNGQRITLTGTRTGNALAGKLKVEGPVAQTKLTSGAQNAAFPFQITFGEYSYTGSVTPPRGFNINGNFGSLGSFTMSGQLQTATENGSYTLTTNGETETGILPASGTAPNPTATPTTPQSGNLRVSGNLAVSDATAGSAVVTSPFSTFAYTPNDGTLTNVTSLNSQGLSFGASTENLSGNGVRRDIAVALNSSLDSTSSGPSDFKRVPFSVGQKFVMGQNFSNLIQYSQVTVNGTSIDFKIWRAISGDVFVRAIGTNSATLELQNVRMRGITVSGGVDNAAGEFTFNGTLSANGLTAKTQ